MSWINALVSALSRKNFVTERRGLDELARKPPLGKVAEQSAGARERMRRLCAEQHKRDKRERHEQVLPAALSAHESATLRADGPAGLGDDGSSTPRPRRRAQGALRRPVVDRGGNANSAPSCRLHRYVISRARVIHLTGRVLVTPSTACLPGGGPSSAGSLAARAARAALASPSDWRPAGDSAPDRGRRRV